MRCACQKPENMPMLGQLTRESKRKNEVGNHMFILTLRFKKSRRTYTDEYIFAPDKRAALKAVKIRYPHVTMRK